MQLITLQSTKDGKLYPGFVYRDENKNWQFRNWTDQFKWQDSYLTYFKPILDANNEVKTTGVEPIM